MREDPHSEFTGRNILYQAHTIEETAAAVRAARGGGRAPPSRTPERILLEARAKRVRPHLDDKILTAWNGLMISAFAKGGAVLDEPRYAAAARRAADFILARMYDPKTGVLLRRYRAGRRRHPRLPRRLRLLRPGAARSLRSAVRPALPGSWPFASRKSRASCSKIQTDGGFFSTAAGDAEPGDAHEGRLRRRRALGQFRRADEPAAPGADDRPRRFPRIRRPPAARLRPAAHGRAGAAPQMLAAYEFSLSKPKQVSWWATSGLDKLLRELNSRFLPNKIVLLVDGSRRERRCPAYLPVLETMTEKGGQATAVRLRKLHLPATDRGSEKIRGTAAVGSFSG